jgi:hypothetical protein
MGHTNPGGIDICRGGRRMSSASAIHASYIPGTLSGSGVGTAAGGMSSATWTGADSCGLMPGGRRRPLPLTVIGLMDLTLTIGGSTGGVSKDMSSGGGSGGRSCVTIAESSTVGLGGASIRAGLVRVEHSETDSSTSIGVSASGTDRLDAAARLTLRVSFAGASSRAGPAGVEHCETDSSTSIGMSRSGTGKEGEAAPLTSIVFRSCCTRTASGPIAGVPSVIAFFGITNHAHLQLPFS